MIRYKKKLPNKVTSYMSAMINEWNELRTKMLGLGFEECTIEDYYAVSNDTGVMIYSNPKRNKMKLFYDSNELRVLEVVLKNGFYKKLFYRKAFLDFEDYVYEEHGIDISDFEMSEEGLNQHCEDMKFISHTTNNEIYGAVSELEYEVFKKVQDFVSIGNKTYTQVEDYLLDIKDKFDKKHTVEKSILKEEYPKWRESNCSIKDDVMRIATDIELLSNLILN